jgi:hypothetical protein
MDDPTPFEQAAANRREAGPLRELAAALWQHKRWWLVPVVAALLLLGVLLALSGSAAAPLIYTLF